MIRILVALICSIGFSGSIAIAQNKDSVKQVHYQDNKRLVESGQFEFTGNNAFPQKGGAVDLTTRQNFLKFEDNRASAAMPYFGQSTGGGYGNTNVGVVFDGEMIDYAIQENVKKGRIIISFKIKNKSELYNCTLTISSTYSASLSVSSSVKQAIRYSGKIKPLK